MTSPALPLPAAYQWLGHEPGPKMILSALYYFGIHEAPGGVNNPIILAWAKELSLNYNADSIPWCGLFMAKCARDAGKQFPVAPLWARNWVGFGISAPMPMLGDALVFARLGGGHVGLYVGQDADAYHVLGGNEGDAVAIVRIARARLLAARRPIYSVQPANVRVITLAPSGAISTDEG
jgi:uncharacterized protein (TIGR02594 family)